MTNKILKSLLEIPEDSDFSMHNIPFGIIKNKNNDFVAATRIGNYVIDLFALYELGYFDNFNFNENILKNKFLNDFISLGKSVTNKFRDRIIELFNENNNELKKEKDIFNKCIYEYNKVKTFLPVNPPDYTDFYSSLEHARNVGTMFRGTDKALMPNWKHLPVAYHGRSSSIIISGTPFHRPKGQIKEDNDKFPKFGPSKLLDFELEMAFIIGKETKLGEVVTTKNAEEYIFGFLLFNDWSARDIQKWEYVPLGPFLGKNFASSVSPWIVTLEALKPFKVHGPEQDTPVLPYLSFEGKKNYDINLEVYIKPKGSEASLVCKSNTKYLYWNVAQQLAHHTVNGCNIRVGDMMASGTISGPEPHQFGSMLELTWRGTKPLKMKDGSERKFLQDYDTVIMKAYAEKNGIRVGFGSVETEILPAK